LLPLEQALGLADWGALYCPNLSSSNHFELYPENVSQTAKYHSSERIRLTNAVEKCEHGYPYLASFLDSDENFMIYRRFGFLHARLLLQKQDELRIMEEELDRMDQRDKMQNVRLLQCRIDDDLRADQVGETRKLLLSRIEDVILKYDQLLLNAQQLVAANRPPQRDYNSVANFVNHKKPLIRGDDDFIYYKEDLITLRPGRESAWFDAIVEKMLKFFPRAVVKYIFCSKVRLVKDIS
jgi:hypothetical protein